MNNRPNRRSSRWTITAGFIVLLCLMILVLVSPTTSVMACSPLPTPILYTVTDRTNAAEVVLEGTVVALVGEHVMTATVEVSRYFKDSGPALVDIAHLGSSAACLSQVYVGEHWIFYTSGDPLTGLTAHYLGPFSAVDAATADNIAQVIAAVETRWLYLPIIFN